MNIGVEVWWCGEQTNEGSTNKKFKWKLEGKTEFGV